MRLFAYGFLAGSIITSHFFNGNYLIYFLSGLLLFGFILFKSYQKFDRESADFWEEEYE